MPQGTRSGGQAMRVLVTEDDEILATAVAAGLRREGMAVDVTLDGAMALERQVWQMCSDGASMDPALPVEPVAVLADPCLPVLARVQAPGFRCARPLVAVRGVLPRTQ